MDASCFTTSLCLIFLIASLSETTVAQECTRNFQDVLTSDGSRRGQEERRETRIIPSMQFTCKGTIVGYTITGRNRNGTQDPRIQIWRENKAQCGKYYKPVSDIVVHESSCANVTALDSVAPAQIFHCSLKPSAHIQVQMGDVFGLELPRTDNDDFELYFTDGGPTNYVFQRRITTSTIELATSSSTTEEQPQIILDIIPDQPCSSGLGEASVTSNGSGVGEKHNTITRLIPELKFTCEGTITQFVVGGTLQPGSQDPMIQVWRESTTMCGTFVKPVPDIPINSSVCDGGASTISEGKYRCTLKEAFRVPVQPGDILGLEIPPTSEDDFELHFTSGGPTNYVFQNQPSTSTPLSSRSTEDKQQPQIHVVVETTATTESTTSQNAVDTTESAVMQGATASGNVGGIVAGIIIGVAILAGLIVMVVIVIVVLQRRSKRFSTSNGTTRTSEYPLSNAVYGKNPITSVVNDIDVYDTPIDGGFDYEDVDEKDLNVDMKEAKLSPEKSAITTQEYSGNYYSPTPPQLSASHVINYESPVPTLQRNVADSVPTLKPCEPSTEPEEDLYWEPSNDANELYQQLASKKYREIETSHIRIKRVLGSGQFGTVNQGIWQSPMGDLDVAVKQLKPGASETEKIKFLREAAINGQFRHPNVVKLMGVVTGSGPTMIVLELLSNGDLLSFLLNLRPNPGETVSTGTQQKLLRFCQHVVSGMSYLASKSFIHRDLAARNILVSEDGICKISDFGMSRDIEEENYYVSSGGKVPVKWTAPEALHFKKYSTASDVWSFGCVMYEIWSLGHKPFENYSNAETIRLVDKGYILPPPPGLSKELYKIMIQCWKPESARRPKFPQLVEMLSRAEFELFEWEDEDIKDKDPQVKTIGAPLEVARDLYTELQQSYVM